LDKRLITLFVAILIIGTAARLATIRFNSLIEPDDYFYQSVISQTMSNHLILTSQLSGFPFHNIYTERPGLIYIPILLTYLTHNITFSLQLLGPLFGLLEMLVVYVLTYKLSNNRYAGLLAMFIFAIMPANIWKNTSGSWRGETFVPFFVALAVLASIKLWESKDNSRRILYSLVVLSLILLSLWSWVGGQYILAVIGFYIILVGVSLLFRNVQYKNTKTLLVGITILCIISYTAIFILHLNLGGLTGVAAGITEVRSTQLSNFISSFGIAFFIAIIGIVLAMREDRQYVLWGILAILIPSLFLFMVAVRWDTLLSISVAILSGYALYVGYLFTKAHIAPIMAYFSIFMMLSVQILFFTASAPLFGPVNGINQQLISTMSWIRNNTATNATFLTLWPDGSLIEGIANRTSYTDSISGQNQTRVYDFAQFLYAKKGNLTYLYHVSPDYLLVRKYWLTEAIAENAGLNQSMEYNGTNYQALENATIGLPIVYNSGGTIIYKVK
jgi:asparagine N-glycosylation enzyme membrane subunit Stt3